MPEHQRELTDIVTGVRDDVVQRVVAEELRPVVREAITEDVLRGIADLVALTPDTVSALTEDLASVDSTIRQRAYSLILKYTLGNAAVAPKDSTEGKQLVVNFALPRPEPTGEKMKQVESDTGDSRPCDICGTDFSEDQFVDGSDRCQDCYRRQREEVRERFGED